MSIAYPITQLEFDALDYQLVLVLHIFHVSLDNGQVSQMLWCWWTYFKWFTAIAVYELTPCDTALRKDIRYELNLDLRVRLIQHNLPCRDGYCVERHVRYNRRRLVPHFKTRLKRRRCWRKRVTTRQNELKERGLQQMKSLVEQLWEKEARPEVTGDSGLPRFELASTRHRARLMTAAMEAYIATTAVLAELSMPILGAEPELSIAYLASHHGNVPIVLDTGCSMSITPFEEDFVGEITPVKGGEMHGLTDSVSITGIGQVEWCVRDVFGRIATIRTKAYHIPKASIRLLSTQTYFKENGAGSLLQSHEKVVISTPGGVELVFPYQPNNLPLAFLDANSSQIGITERELACLLKAEELDKHLTLLNKHNHNLNSAQKELMLWHYRLAHCGQSLLQHLMRPRDVRFGAQSRHMCRPAWLWPCPRSSFKNVT